MAGEQSAQTEQGAQIAQSDSTQVHAGNWKEFLPKPVQEWQEVQQSDTPEKFFDQVANMRKFMGQSIRIPSHDAGQEQMDQFYNRLQEKVPGLMRTPNPEDEKSIEHVMRALGVPESDKEYSFDGAATEDEIGGLRAMAKDLKLTKSQFKKFAESMTSANQIQREKNTQALDAQRQALQKDWGAAYDERMENVLNIAEATGASKHMIEAIKAKTLDADTAKWIYQMGKQLGGEAINAHVQQKNMSPSEASENISDILNNQAHPYWNSDHPDHKKAVDKVINLHRLANAAH